MSPIAAPIDGRAGRHLSPSDPELNWRPCPLPPGLGATLFVIIDAEEEFDWSAPFERTNNSVRAIRAIGPAQRRFERYGVRPTFVIDFPVASQPDGFQPLAELAASGACELGAHLHPWVNPPFEEETSARNSYACNLPPRLEEAKLRALVETIGANTGRRARTYRAGRYGFGRSAAALLERLGFDADTSVNPHMDYSPDGGPSFELFDARPALFGRTRSVLELPCSRAIVGLAGRLAAPAYLAASRPPLATLKAHGVLARLGLAQRIMLSPEGHSLEELKWVTRHLLRRGIRTLTLSFHSPSLEPGHTPYVRSGADLERFLGVLEAYLDFFFGDVGGVSSTPEDFVDSLHSTGLAGSGESAVMQGHAS